MQEKIIAILLGITLTILSLPIFYKEYQYTANSSYSMAKINKLWDDIDYNSDSYKFYIAYSFKNTDNKEISIKSETLREYLWKDIAKGTKPPLVEYFPEKNPSQYRIYGNGNVFWAYILLAAGLFSFYFSANTSYKGNNTTHNTKKTKKKTKKRKRYVPS